jgi:hypothetical protein
MYYRLRSAIQEGSADGVRQILKLRTINNPEVWKKLCPHIVWDKLRSIETETDAGTLWFDILGTELEEYLEDTGDFHDQADAHVLIYLHLYRLLPCFSAII